MKPTIFNKTNGDYYIAMLDSEKAFDRVDPTMLVATMIRQGIPMQLVLQVTKWLSINHVQLAEGRLKTKVSTPQGSIQSPLYFSVMINGLTDAVKASGAKILLFADDILILARGKAQLTQALTAVEQWSTCHNFKVNRAKSGILKLRHKTSQQV